MATLGACNASKRRRVLSRARTTMDVAIPARSDPSHALVSHCEWVSRRARCMWDPVGHVAGRWLCPTHAQLLSERHVEHGVEPAEPRQRMTELVPGRRMTELVLPL